MNIPKEVINQWWNESLSKSDGIYPYEYIAQRAAEWALSQPVSMEPQIMGMEEVDFNEFKPVYGYTATQLAQARQQGAEEERKKWESNLPDVLKQRIAELEAASDFDHAEYKRLRGELEQKNAVFLEALKIARDTAMTREDVIRLARKTGFDSHDMSDDFTYNLKDIERFAELVIKEHSQQVINDPAEIRRVFEIDAAEYPEPESGFAKL